MFHTFLHTNFPSFSSFPFLETLIDYPSGTFLFLRPGPSAVYYFSIELLNFSPEIPVVSLVSLSLGPNTFFLGLLDRKINFLATQVSFVIILPKYYEFSGMNLHQRVD